MTAVLVPPLERRRAWALILAAAGMLAVAQVSLLREIPVVGDWFYNFSWWSYILLINGVVHLRTGSSLLLSRPRAFFLLLPWSCAFWLFFEGANFVLQNWYYVNAPREGAVRAFGIAISFATVLPGIYGTAALLRCAGLFERARSRPVELTPGRLRAVTGLGVVCLLLPLVLPDFAFPLIWASTLLLLEPWIARRGGRCLLTLLARGEAGPALRLLATGLLCGLLWELWNYWADSKWIYTVPFFETGKLFEMPVLGFLGFPPFALECYTFGRFLVAAGLLPEWEDGVEAPAAPRTRRMAAGLVLAAAAAVPLAFGVSRWTVRSTPALVSDLAGMPAGLAARLAGDGLDRADELAQRLRSGEMPAALAERPVGEREDWLRQGELMQLRGMGLRGLRWLQLAGVHSVAALARAEPEALAAAWKTRAAGPPPHPHPREVRGWVRAAREQDK